MGGEELCRAQQHGGVAVVAAGVHGAVLGGVGQAGVFPDGQGVDVRPEQHGFAWLSAHEVGHQAGVALEPGDGDAEGGKLRRDVLGGLVFTETQLRVLMKMAA